MEKANRIAVLASIIADNTTKIDSYLVSKDLPTPSFDPDTPASLLFDPSIAAARQAVLEATDELNALMLGPMMILASPTTLVSKIE